MTATIIDLLRHGQPEGGEIFRGATDVALSDTGWQQMRAATQELAGWQRVLTSPMQRCQAFADEISQRLHIPSHTHHDLREISFGDWDGMAFQAVSAQYGSLFNDYWRDPINNTPPNAEPMPSFCQRVQQAFWQSVEAHQGQHLLLVVHGGVIRAILSEVMKSEAISLMRYEVPYACLSRIKIYHDDGRHWPQLVFHNRASSLR